MGMVNNKLRVTGGRMNNARWAGQWAVVAAMGIAAVAGLEGYALSQGINGHALTASLAAIAALGGTGLGRLLK